MLKKITWITGMWVTGATITCAALIWVSTRPHQVVDFPSHPQPATPTLTQAPLGEAVIPPVEEWDAELVNQFQMQALAEVIKTVGQPEPEHIKERPPYISPAEWLILQTVAERHPKPDQELSRMVNYLRFTKLLEVWEKGDELTEPMHTQLTEHLLHTLPARVEHGDINRLDAQQLQVSMINQLINDPQKRRHRLTEENARIGVVFEFN